MQETFDLTVAAGLLAALLLALLVAFSMRVLRRRAREPQAAVRIDALLQELARRRAEIRDAELERSRFLLETSIAGVFAAGDVRAGSVKRVGAAVGEGSMAIQFIHEHLRGE